MELRMDSFRHFPRSKKKAADIKQTAPETETAIMKTNNWFTKRAGHACGISLPILSLHAADQALLKDDKMMKQEMKKLAGSTK